MNAIRHAAPQVWTDPVSLRVLGMGTALPGPPVETGALLNLMNTRFGLDLGILARDDYDGAARPGAKLSRVFHGQLGTGHPPGLFATSGGSDCPGVPGGLHEFEHDYAAVRLAGPALLRRCAASALKAGITGADWTLPHQADGRMDELLEKLIGMPRGRVVTGGGHVGNTGSAAIWLGLAQHRASLRPGDTVLALGAEATAHMFGGFRYEHG